MDIGKKAAETAIRLDPSLCEPYASLGFYYTALVWNWTEGKKYFNRSIELNPGYAFGHYLFGLYYYAWVMGNFKKAEEHGRIAIKLEPLSSIAHAVYSLILVFAGKPEEALAAANAGLELDPNAFLCYRSITLSYWGLKKYKEAIDSAEHLIKISNRHPHSICDLMAVYADTGDIEAAKTLMQELKQRSAGEYIDAAYMGLSAAFAGNIDEAFTYFDAALIERDPMMITLKHADYSTALSKDPRYKKLLDRIGFP